MTGLWRKFAEGAVFGAGFSIALAAIFFGFTLFTRLGSADPLSDPSGAFSQSELAKLRVVVERVNFVSGRISVEGTIENATDIAIASLYFGSMIRVAGVPVDTCNQSFKQRVAAGEAKSFVIICGKSIEIIDPKQLSADVKVEAAYSK